MASSLSPLSLFILTLSLLSTTTTAQQQPSASILNAADTLANSGYTSMSLTLQLIAPTLPRTGPTLTVFSPPDASFASSGQPSLSHLLLHFSPLSLSPSSLLSLPFSSTIPSLSPSKHLTITSTANNNNRVLISINNVTVSQSPIYDDGFVLVYAIDDFFNYNFTMSSAAAGANATRVSDLQCSKLERVSIYGEASGVLKSRGYSIMGSFLDLQLMGFLGRRGDDDVKWSVFAPVDAELVGFSGDFLGYSSLFMRHLVPCRVGWADLEEMVNGSQVSKNVDGFSMEITRDDEMLMVNGVEITNPEMYESERLVVHGIRGVIPLPENAEEFPDDKDEESTALDRGEF